MKGGMEGVGGRGLGRNWKEQREGESGVIIF